MRTQERVDAVMHQGAVQELRHQGVKAGQFRPITLWPFPIEALKSALLGAERLVVVEASAATPPMNGFVIAANPSGPTCLPRPDGGRLSVVSARLARHEPFFLSP